MTTLERALEALLELIRNGWEYPDAEWKISQRFKVSHDELREAYDAFHEGK